MKQMVKKGLCYSVVFSLLATVLLNGRWTAGAQAQTLNRAGLLVRFGDGTLVTRCIEFSEDEITGYELLERSGLTFIATYTPGAGAAVCKIEQEGCPPENCFCQSPPDFWSYWLMTDGQWAFSPLGSTPRQVHHGDMDAWSWGPGTAQGGSPPPLLTFDEVCAQTTPTPTNTWEPYVIGTVALPPTKTPTVLPPSDTPSPTPSLTPLPITVIYPSPSPTASPSETPTSTPSPLPTDTATPLPTDTAIPPPPPTLPPQPPVILTPYVQLGLDQATIQAGGCTTLRWSASNVQAVYLDNEVIAPGGERQVCPTDSKTYTLRIIAVDGREESHQINLVVNGGTGGIDGTAAYLLSATAPNPLLAGTPIPGEAPLATQPPGASLAYTPLPVDRSTATPIATPLAVAQQATPAYTHAQSSLPSPTAEQSLNRNALLLVGVMLVVLGGGAALVAVLVVVRARIL